ncbi:hypothetical protein [Streptomyces sp. UG1]|uniref:hypothetical protein n=1 Tax=Streptomyces sp. UG1 TaxID=3417652 RepID=UPI003CF07381
MTTLRTRPGRGGGWPLRLLLALSGWLALATATGLPDGSFARALMTTTFLLLGPGAAAVRWARPGAQWRDAGWPVVLEAAFLTVALSLCLAVLAAEVFYLSDAFTPIRVLTALAAVTSLLALLPRRAATGGRAVGRTRPPRTRGPAADEPRG